MDAVAPEIAAGPAESITPGGAGTGAGPAPAILETTHHDGYKQHKVAYETLPKNWVTAYLLVPDGLPAPGPAVVCAHGHFEGGKESVV